MKAKCMSIIMALIPILSLAQEADNDERKARLAEEAKVYFIGADTARYGFKYDFSLLFDKQRKLTYNEQRMVMAADTSTVDMLYDSKKGTPSFFFYYPHSGRMAKTYRIVGEEFLLSDSIMVNHWTFADKDSIIGNYVCRIAEADICGRHWKVWYTTDINAVAAPRHLVGLPGVVVLAHDSKHEVRWQLAEVVEKKEGDMLFVKFPSAFTQLPAEKFDKILRLFSLSKEPGYMQKAEVGKKYAYLMPECLYPCYGIDGCDVTNPIELR